MNFDEFREQVMVSMEDICRDIFRENRDSIKIKKEKVGVKNLVNIFEATLNLSNEKGFHAMSLRDLCRETGLSMGALYSYFSSKDELLAIIQNQGRRMVAKVMQAHIDIAPTPLEKLKNAIRAHLYLSEVMQPWFFFAYMEIRYFRKEEHRNAITAELYTEKLFVDILEEGQASGEFTVSDTTMTASVIKAMLQDWYLKRWKHSRRKITVEDYARFTIEMIRIYLTASPREADV